MNHSRKAHMQQKGLQRMCTVVFPSQRWETCLARVAPPSSLCTMERLARLQPSSCSSR